MARHLPTAEFLTKFADQAEVVAAAPGRINLIGEHTDYNEGFVFPAAIDRHVHVAASRASGLSRLVSLELGPGEEFDAATTEPSGVGGWAAYAAGMAWALRSAGHGPMPNVEAVVSGEIPIGSGVSSSAAIELASGLAFASLAGKRIEPVQMAKIAQRCENEYVGVKSGIMDQMASALGRKGHAMFIDTRSLDVRYVALPAGLAVVVCDTKKPRALTESAYNERRSQCEAAAKALGVAALRDASVQQLEAAKERLDAVTYRRARHVVTENLRCEQFLEALETSDFGQMGDLMRASHDSLRDDFEVSCAELDAMAAAANSAPGCVGARMTGAGFGGVCVALVERSRVEAFRDTTLGAYKASSGLVAEIMPCRVAEGASIVPRPL